MPEKRLERTRDAYKRDDKTTIYFRDMPIHNCNMMIPKDAPLFMLDKHMTHCPFCFEKIDRTDA